MITYDQISLERSDAAGSTAIGFDRHTTRRVDDRQWAMVEKGEADMDAAFVLAVEAEANRQASIRELRASL